MGNKKSVSARRISKQLAEQDSDNAPQPSSPGTQHAVFGDHDLLSASVDFSAADAAPFCLIKMMTKPKKQPKKPVLASKLASATAKSSALSLNSEADWNGCLEDVRQVENTKKAGTVVPVHILVTDQYLASLASKLGKGKAAPTKGRSKGKVQILDLDHAESGDDDFDEELGDSSVPGIMLAALNIRSWNTPAPAPRGDDLAHLELIDDSARSQLINCARGYEEKDMPRSSPGMHYWTYNLIEHRVPQLSPFIFSGPDLLSALINLCFIHKNLYFPVFHRRTFERSIAEGLT
ncbi:hypothetical protein B0H10DRAFT_2221777 [Mycena sp. CBHHK59/15]|nr:hypothetical protein B0H10DRAFT_2221777 [Mycena sp. CBHHK59/15]